VRISFSLLAALSSLFCVAVASSSRPADHPDFPVSFSDITEQAGLLTPVIYGGVEEKRYIIETNGCGVALADFDNDGWLDILVLSGTLLEAEAGNEPMTRLYLNQRDGTFQDATSEAGLEAIGWASAVTVGDYDNDGWEDIFITYWGRNRLFRNEGDAKFRDVTEEAGLGRPETRWGSGCVFIDYDRDGHLDLFIANYLVFDLDSAQEPGKGPNCLWKGIAVNCGPKGLPTDTNLLYRNRGDGTFEDVSESSGVSLVTGRYPMTAVVTDYNQDGWPDIYVACDSTASILYQNNGDGTFTDVALEAAVAYNEDGQAQAGMGVAIGDYDGDGLLDIFKTHFADDLPVLYRNMGDGYFEDVSRAAGFDHTRYVQWGTGLVDLDNDGRPDIVTVSGNVYPEVEEHFPEYPHRNPRLVYRNLGNGRFQDVSRQVGEAARQAFSSRGAAFGDIDNDGDIDVVIMNMNDRPQILRNDHIHHEGERRGNNWLKLKLVGTTSNRSAIGARVVVTAGETTMVQEISSQSSYYSHNDPRLHFGLGPLTHADRVEIRWPSGGQQTLSRVPGNQILVVVEKHSDLH
jgi:enediyne biosynthesis protein E4